jgi:glycosyltransferase involved in cell wall biosynthesis
VVEAFPIDPQEVVVVRHGVGSPSSAIPSDAEVRHRYGLGSGPFVVLPGITHPHKGHEFLLELMATEWDDDELRVVLLGGRGAADATIERRIDELGLRQRLVRPGRVSALDRDGIIAAADALVFPSEYEGFGAPVLEAMALGTPVICSDQPALVEVVGAAGLALPREREAWSGALDDARRRRSELIAAGRARAAEFTIAASGDDLAAAYRLANERGVAG